MEQGRWKPRVEGVMRIHNHRLENTCNDNAAQIP
jgi:hypothetical protein